MQLVIFKKIGGIALLGALLGACAGNGTKDTPVELLNSKVPAKFNIDMSMQAAELESANKIYSYLHMYFGLFEYEKLVENLNQQQQHEKLQHFAQEAYKVADFSGDYDDLKLAGKISAHLGDYAQLEKITKQMLQQNQDDKQANAWLFHVYMQGRNYAKAAQQFYKVIKKEQGVYSFDSAMRLINPEQNPEAALQLSKQMPRTAATRDIIDYSNINALAAQGKYTQALQLVRELNSAQPDNERAIEKRIDLLLATKRDAELREFVTDCFNILPASSQSFKKLMYKLRQHKLYALSLDGYKRSLQQHPKSNWLNVDIGEMYLKMMQFNAMIDWYAKQRPRDLDFVEINLLKGRAYEYLSKPKQAEHEYKQVLNNPKSNDKQILAANLRLTIIAFSSNRNELAGQYMQAVEAILPRLSAQTAKAFEEEITLMRIEVWMMKDKLKQAYDYCEQQLQLDPENQMLRFSHAVIAVRLNKIDVGIADYEQLLKLDANNASYLNSLGYVLASNDRDLPRALDLISRAHQQMPDNPAILDSMGWAYYKLKRYDEALAYIEKSRSLQEYADAEVELHMGAVLWELGRQDEAMQLWRDAVKQFPKDRDLQQILQSHEADKP